MLNSDTIDRAIDSALDRKTIVGSVVLVAREGDIAYERCAGFADREAGIPTRRDTIFRLASVTKPIVAATALALVDKGLLDLDDAVADYLPYFRPRLADGREPTIRIRHLLTHTAGLNYLPTPEGEYPPDALVDTGLLDTDLSFEENFTRLAAIPLDYEPGTRWVYSVAIDVLGAVIAKVDGTTLEHAVVRHVAGPLGMDDTRFHVTDETRLAVPYGDASPEPVRMGDPHLVPDPATGGIAFSPSRIFNPKAYQSGGAGMAGTPDDILALLNAVARGGEPILSREIVEAALQNQIGSAPRGPDDEGERFCFLGAVLEDRAVAGADYPSGTVHWGGVYGHSWFIDPVNKLTAVLMTNTALEGCTGAYPDDITRAIYS